MKEIINKKRVNIILIISIFFIFNSIFTFSSIITAEEPEWELTIFFSEPNGYNDYCVIGEVNDAIDGPPHDEYDEPKPPATFPPCIYSWFNDNLNPPYDILLKDFRKYDDAVYKQWNLSLQWMSYSGGTQLNISWNINDLIDIEYDFIYIIDLKNDIETDMVLNSYYEFSCNAWEINYFNIICTSTNNAPKTPNKPSGEIVGYHNNIYDYSFTTTDPNEDELFYLIDWGDGSNSEWIGPYSSGEICIISHLWQQPGTFNITAKAKDIFGFESNWSPPLIVSMYNRPPLKPYNRNPENESEDININTFLSWNAEDPDGDIITFDVFFGTENPPPKLIEKQSSNKFDPSITYNTTYYWKIESWDNFGESSKSPIWSFTTTEKSNGESNDNGYPTNDSQNIPPFAKASVSETLATIGTQIIFNASESYDPDGYIKNWSWEFGDGEKSDGEIVTYIYQENGLFNISLTVTDNLNLQDQDFVQIFIGLPNTPPNEPTISGPTTGNKNIEYSYTITSIDNDKDDISFIVDWGDGNYTNTNYISNGSTLNLTHSWSNAGIYKLSVKANDDETFSNESILLVLIDSKMIDNVGFLIDLDGDEIFDMFQNISNHINSSVEIKDGQYLLDINGDGSWDYIYDYQYDELTSYKLEPGNEIPWSIVILITLASIIILIIVYFYKKGSF